MKILRIDQKMSQTVYSPGSQESEMNLASKEATQNGPPVSGGPPNNDSNSNICLGKNFDIDIFHRIYFMCCSSAFLRHFNVISAVFIED